MIAFVKKRISKESQETFCEYLMSNLKWQRNDRLYLVSITQDCYRQAFMHYFQLKRREDIAVVKIGKCYANCFFFLKCPVLLICSKVDSMTTWFVIMVHLRVSI